MKNTLLTLALVIGILFTTAWAQQPRTQWEYKVEWNGNEKKANTLGAEGWELIAVDTHVNVQSYVFKRAK